MVVHCALSSSHDTQLTTFLLTLANFVIILIGSHGVYNTPPICLYTTNQHNMYSINFSHSSSPSPSLLIILDQELPHIDVLTRQEKEGFHFVLCE